MKEADELMRALNDLRGMKILGALRSLGNPLRLKILSALIDQRRPVNEICKLTDIQQSAASNQLARLRLDGLVSFERDGHTIYYSLCHDGVRDILGVLATHRTGVATVTGRQKQTDMRGRAPGGRLVRPGPGGSGY